jgi:hypothetical protein
LPSTSHLKNMRFLCSTTYINTSYNSQVFTCKSLHWQKKKIKQHSSNLIMNMKGASWLHKNCFLCVTSKQIL